MRRRRTLAVVAASLLAWVLAATSLAATAAEFGRDRIEIVSQAGARHPFEVEVAATPEQLAQGLMFRDRLPAEGGMLFDFGRVQPVAMWMKNTLIPLDMLFIAADGRVIFIAERTVPHSLAAIGPGEPVRAVLEINGGTAHRLGLRPGDRVRHRLFGGF
ncbi:DUF192 domain-containing protein [Magnetospirillum sp. UT-4]|uniref:DUF192 domain-containing protein n=1 Tax=Magnetospirillum sp. UT-4 TaxID=2681467 RepID=UPI0013830983|nr:DUF192 domain-containing protein [Magnetospirillum sp. UT-4]CAA7614167.1 conserved exported hypothetical protein [Magnetospirillum sp. UT-4]